MNRPWMMALEMQFAALRQTSPYYEREATALEMRFAAALRQQTHEPLDAVAWVRHTQRLLRRATCYSFTKDTSTAISLASRTIPESTEIGVAVFPCRDGWWWFDDPITISDLHSEGDQCCALSWSCLDDRSVWICAWVMAALDPGPIPVFAERATSHAETLGHLARAKSEADPNERQNISVSLSVWRFLLAGTAWINQRIAVISFGHVERHRRKQLVRENNNLPVSDVKVVQLRRAEATTQEPSGPSSSVDWSCRWVVNGHWRNQIYANHEHKLIYILPYVKGPDDKPLKIPTHTVYSVSR